MEIFSSLFMARTWRITFIWVAISTLGETKMSHNKWIIDRGYGKGVAVAFQGDEDFVRKSSNFAENFLLTGNATVKEYMPTFHVVYTTMEKLIAALEFEGYCQKLSELHRNRPKYHIEDEDVPDSFNERCKEFLGAFLKGDYSLPDPTKYLHEEETEEMREIAREHGRQRAQIILADLVSEDFMARISDAPLPTHDVIE